MWTWWGRSPPRRTCAVAASPPPRAGWCTGCGTAASWTRSQTDDAHRSGQSLRTLPIASAHLAPRRNAHVHHLKFMMIDFILMVLYASTTIIMILCLSIYSVLIEKCFYLSKKNIKNINSSFIYLKKQKIKNIIFFFDSSKVVTYKTRLIYTYFIVLV